MQLEAAIQRITDAWDSLPRDTKGECEAVWVAQSDTAGSYEVDEEWIGVTKDGAIAWAYASGCSCWDGKYSSEHVATVKALTLVHAHPPEAWENAIITFAENGFKQIDLEGH